MNPTEQFFQAVEAGDTERVRILLSENPELVRARDAGGATALHHAAFHAHRDIVSLLCSSGADLNARDTQFDATPAGWAIHYLRELGGLLAVEVEDALHAIRTRDVLWLRRLVSRHPVLRTAMDKHGKPLAEHARESGDLAIRALFDSTRIPG